MLEGRTKVVYGAATHHQTSLPSAVIGKKNVTSGFLRNPWKHVQPEWYEEDLQGLKMWARIPRRFML